jgi:ABC-type lipoprotein export system ATPase subunit
MVTHDYDIAALAGRKLVIRDGKLLEEEPLGVDA